VLEKLKLPLFLSKSAEKAIFMTARSEQAADMNPSTILLSQQGRGKSDGKSNIQD
jgi:hypothetical protein